MREETIVQCIRVLPVIMAILCFCIVLLLGHFGRYSKGNREKGFGIALQRLADRGKDLPWYGACQSWLKCNGAVFHLGIEINPFAYLLFRLGLGMTGFLIFLSWNTLYAIVAMIGLYMLPWGLILYMNSRDNIGMLQELKHIYHSLEIQTRAGVYITDALAELYSSVRDRRLRSALLELAGDLVIRSDLAEALGKFSDKFDNRYIDSLCMIILQAMESGQAIELLSDLSEQIKDMEAAVLQRKKEALDRSVTFYQLGILAAIMGIVLYACVTQMVHAAISF